MRDTEVRHTAHPVVRKGFTLVELLVVITIIGLLMSLVLPAVSAARAAARAVQCKNNLHNLQYGVQLYQAQRGTFPPSWKPALPDANGNVNGWSTLGLILPYLEQVNLSDHIDYSLSYSLAPPLAGQPGKLSATRVPVFICPDEQNDYVRLKNGQPYHYPLNYAVNQGGWFTYNPATKKFGSGAFHPNSKFTGAHFRDGLSHTIALGEIRPYCSYYQMIGWWRESGMRAGTTVPINWDTCPENPCWRASNNDPAGFNCRCHHHRSWQVAAGFKSPHPGGANFVLGDGAVTFLSENIDFRTYNRLGDRHDGEIIQGIN